MGYFCDFDGCFFEPTTIELEQDLIKIRDVFRYSPQKSYFLSRYAMPISGRFMCTLRARPCHRHRPLTRWRAAPATFSCCRDRRRCALLRDLTPFMK